MKKSLGLAAVFGVVMLLAVPVTGQAETIDNNSNTTKAVVGLTQDPDSKVELTNAPSFDFGSTVLTAKGFTPEATIKDDIVVANPGFATGWRVDVSMGPFITSDGSDTIKNSLFSIDMGTVTREESSNNSAPPASFSVDPNENPKPIFQAVENEGLGVWHTSYSAKDIRLEIPAGNVSGDYSATMTWTLAEFPAE